MWRTRRCPGSDCPTIGSSPTGSSPSLQTRWTDKLELKLNLINFILCPLTLFQLFPLRRFNLDYHRTVWLAALTFWNLYHFSSASTWSILPRAQNGPWEYTRWAKASCLGGKRKIGEIIKEIFSLSQSVDLVFLTWGEGGRSGRIPVSGCNKLRCLNMIIMIIKISWSIIIIDYHQLL